MNSLYKNNSKHNK